MEKIDVEEILKNNHCYPEQMKKIVPKDGKRGTHYDRIQSVIKEIVEKVIDRCAQEAKCHVEIIDTLFETQVRKKVDKQSILKVKEQIDYL